MTMRDMHVSYREPTSADIMYICQHLKENDLKEVIGLTGRNDLFKEVSESVEASCFKRAALFDGKPVAIFGIRRTHPILKVGCVWMLTTPDTQTKKYYVGKTTKQAIKIFMKDWELLYNYVDEGNEFSIRWLKFLGARIKPAKAFGAYGCRYHYFEFTKDGVR